MTNVCFCCTLPHTPAQAMPLGGGIAQIGVQVYHVCSSACQQRLGPLIAAGKRPSDEPEPAKAERPAPEFETYTSIKENLATYGNGVTLAPSGIAGAGLGLFATRDFQAGEPITEYTGQLISHAQGRKLSLADRSHVRARFGFRDAIDGKRMPDGTPITDPATQMAGRGIAAFANDAYNSATYSNNADFDIKNSPATDAIIERGNINRLDREGERVVFIRATRLIKAGEEIFIPYGTDYWRGYEGPRARSIFS